MHNYLKKILEEKRRVVEQLAHDVLMQKKLQPILNGERKQQHSKSFSQALSLKGMHVIAEVKRKSPSKGNLAEIADPVALAKKYETAGASAISVLTDKFGFAGSVDDLAAVASAVSCPVLRKDFIIDRLQIAEAIYYGASAVLLIVAVLGEMTKQFIDDCNKMGIDALVEVHNKEELAIALTSNAEIIGINNRNLETFEVDINNALTLGEMIPDGVLRVAESGIKNIETAKLYREAGFNAVLVGEALVLADSPATFIGEMVDE
jgi:indole-3-glycerol phosphate synthase